MVSAEQRQKAIKEQQAKQQAQKAKQDAIIAGSKQSRGDNRGFNFSNTGGAHDDGSTPNAYVNPVTGAVSSHHPDGRPKTIQEQNWDSIVNHGTTLNPDRQREQDKQQEALARPTGGGLATHSGFRAITVQTNDNELREITRTRQINEEIRRQEKLQANKKEEIQLLQSKLIQSRLDWRDPEKWERRSRASKRAGDRTSKKIEQQIEDVKKEIEQSNNVISYYEGEKESLQRQESFERSGSFETGESKPTKGIKPPLPVSQAIQGIPFAQQNYQNIKNFLGISDEPKSQTVEQFTPRSFELGTIRADSSRFGGDPNYFSQTKNQQPKSNQVILPSGQVIIQPQPKKTQAEINRDRWFAGLYSVPQNVYQIGKESVEGFSGDIQQGKVGTKEPTELKKDIAITPIEIITKEIEPSSQKIKKGDLSGVSDYFAKTGKGLQEFGSDIAKDPVYYAGNISSNIGVAIGTFGTAQGAQILRAGLRTQYQKHVTQPKAQNIANYLHPPQDAVKLEYKPTGKTQKTQSGLEISEYKQQRTKVPETETVATRKPEKLPYPVKDFYEPKPTGKTKTQKVSPIESFERTADTYGNPTYTAQFKDLLGKYQSVDIIMTPKDPVIRYTGKPQTQPPTKPKTQKGIKLDEQTGQAIKKAIEQDPARSKEIFESYAKQGSGGQFFERPSERITKLATLDESPQKGRIGQIRDVPPETAEALGARGKEIAVQESFYFDDLFTNLSKNPQYANLLKEGKIKPPKSDIPTQRLSLDSQIFAPEYLTGETTITTAFDIKTKQPSHFKKVTPYEKQFFDETQGFFQPERKSKPTKPFEPERKQKTKSDDPDDFFGLLTEKQQQKALSDLKGAGDFAKTTTKDTRTTVLPLAPSQEYAYVEIPKSIIDPFDRPALDSKPDSKALTDFYVGFDEKQSSKQDSGFGLFQDTPQKQQPKIDLLQKPKEDVVPDLDIFKDPQKTPQRQDYDQGFIFRQGTKQPPILTPKLVTDPPVPPFEVPPEEPPTVFGRAGGFPPFIELEDAKLDELLFGKKKTKGKKRFHNVDPTEVLGFFKSELGYQDTEFKQLKGRKKRQSKDQDFSNIGF